MLLILNKPYKIYRVLSLVSLREAEKKSSFLSGRLNVRKKELSNVRKKVPMATKPRGGGLKGLSGRATKIRTFLRLPLYKKVLPESIRLCRLSHSREDDLPCWIQFPCNVHH